MITWLWKSNEKKVITFLAEVMGKVIITFPITLGPSKKSILSVTKRKDPKFQLLSIVNIVKVSLF